MKILVCFKVSENLEGVTDNEWNHCLDKADVPVFLEHSIGIYDEAALEMALQIKDQTCMQECPVDLTALTIGSDVPDIYIRQLFGVKYDRVVHIKYDEDIRFKPDTTADIITNFINENGGYDIVLLGQQSAPGDNGMTHIMAASRLRLPCILNVADIAVESEMLIVTSRIDEGFIKQKVKMPVVLGIGDAVHPYLRVATLRERMAASKKKSEEFVIEKESCTSGENDNVKLYREIKSRKCEFLSGESMKETMFLLYEKAISGAMEEAE